MAEVMPEKATTAPATFLAVSVKKPWTELSSQSKSFAHLSANRARLALIYLALEHIPHAQAPV